ncbi:MAG TPA: TIM-barrel domain-containing protein [Polyangiaceae bacterium]
MRSRWAWGLASSVLALAAVECGGGGDTSPAAKPVSGGAGDASFSDAGADSIVWTAPNGVSVVVLEDPFAFSVNDASGRILVETIPFEAPPDAGDPLAAYAPLGLTHDTDESGATLMYGWAYFKGQDDPWKRASKVASSESAADHLTLHLATTDAAHPSVTLKVSARDSGVRLIATVDAPDPNDQAPVNRLSFGFAMHPDDHFMGFGERYVYGDHRGQMLYDWVEDDGLGNGEQTPVGPHNPSPNGPGQTHIPIPWFMDPRGFGMLLNSTWRSNAHLGEERPDAWRLESTEGTLDVSFFVDPDPMKLVASLTAVTGRPPAIADWVLAPRRRANIGTDEVQRLRAAHIPTSVIDTATHYFPNGDGSNHAAMQQVTSALHAAGFKAVAYFCPFVADSWHPVFDDAAANGYFVKHPDGTPYVVLDPPYSAAMVDFTNPAATAWFVSYLQQALDDGWDGWMYDFAEYVPQDAVLFNGKTGLEMHNEYPVLYQQAAFDFFEAKRPGDYLFFARSGYLGTGGSVPMVWAGDQATDFDLADGLPAALCGALNAGMSGIPLWGSDISGYHYLYNPPPDKEVYLRWTEVGAFSADMHDENEGSGTGPASERWQIWDDQESQDVYRKYALVKTRMLPYVRVAVREARATGAPVMRHLYLSNPTDPRVYQMQDEYLFGDSLLVAPVVTRGQTSRDVYLPEPQYFDFWSGVRVIGGGDLNVPAPLDTVPVFARLGAIVPMLSPDVETVVPSSDGSVVSLQDRADYLEVQIFAGGSSSLTLDDGTVFTQSAPAAPFDPGSTVTRVTGGGAPMTPASSATDLETCDACYLRDGGTNVLYISVRTASDAFTAGPLAVSVSASPSVKRYLFTVRF